MRENICKTKIYCVEWEDSLYILSLNFNKEGLVTHYFRPLYLKEITRNERLRSEQQEDEFLCICTKYIIGLSVCSEEKDTIERNIGALTFSIMDSIMTKGNISFGDLLHHIDCFSMMLKEEGLTKDKIRTMYVPISKAILSNFKDVIIDVTTGEKFIDTPKYKEFECLAKQFKEI